MAVYKQFLIYLYFWKHFIKKNESYLSIPVVNLGTMCKSSSLQTAHNEIICFEGSAGWL